MSDFLSADFRRVLVGAIRDALRAAGPRRHGGSSLPEQEQFRAQFFGQWFKQEGHSYFFLFRQNLTITNIQFAELIALIRDSCRRGDGDRSRGLIFRSSGEFNSLLDELKDHLDLISQRGPRKRVDESAIKHVVENYGPLLERTIVFDTFYGSAAVFVPPGLSIDLARICGLSGYVHSCGTNIYLRKTGKADAGPFIDAVRQHVESRPSGDEIFFIPYSHEDFSPYDSLDPEKLRHGLDGFKIQLERFHMGASSLVDVMDELRSKVKGLSFLEPGDYRAQYPWVAGRNGAFRGRTIWLISDTSVRMDTHPHRGDDRFYVCYEQEFMYDVAFHLFEENMPGWVSPTTTPHALAAAMINISKPWEKSNGEQLRFVDPFVGSGTIWLEALKHKELSPEASDVSRLTDLVLADNLAFFAKPASELAVLAKDLGAISESAHNEPPDSTLGRAIRWANAYFKVSSEIPATPTPELVHELKDSPERRFVYYLLLRVQWRSGRAMQRRSQTREDSLRREIDRLSRQITKLIQLRNRQTEVISQGPGNLFAYRGICSPVSGISIEALSDAGRRASSQVTAGLDVMDLPKRYYDVIVADPPYGFNADVQRRELADLYTGSMRAMIDALRNNGHLVISLADRSHTGRWLPFFTNRLLVSQQVLAIAEDLKRHAFMESRVVPHLPARGFFLAPYYWESEGSLRRAILHFQFRDDS